MNLIPTGEQPQLVEISSDSESESSDSDTCDESSEDDVTLSDVDLKADETDGKVNLLSWFCQPLPRT